MIPRPEVRRGRGRRALWMALALCALPAIARAAPTGFELEPDASPGPTPLAALTGAPAETNPALAFLFFHRRKSAPPAVTDSTGAPVEAGAPAGSEAGSPRKHHGHLPPPKLGAERARIVLRSLTVPGWGQATMGHPRAAKVFGLLELGVWASFSSFRVQESLRRESYENTAHIFAGIDMRGRDEEFRRIVGAYSSSAEYNQLVVSRDAANLYLSDPQNPDYAGYHAYIAAHQLQGRDTWTWQTDDTRLRYRGQRKAAQRAAQRANAALAVAVLNRLVSVLHASRMRPADEVAPHTLRFEIAPDPGKDPTAFHLGVRATF